MRERILESVLDAIARAVLGDAGDSAVTLGVIALHRHQRDALRRVRASVDEVGGALLADEPGLGKSFVALALARDFPAATVIGPAALRTMWRDAAKGAGVDIAFISFEALSRGDRCADGSVNVPGGLVIVDEAHHVCNPATARYARLSTLVAYRRVLLLSATPVRNRRAELSALLALFMGPRAFGLDDAALARCIVRRPGDTRLLPEIDGPHWHRVRAIPRLRELISTLPPPLPALDGREATALLTMTLARCWSSSLAALDTALKRRLQRGAALAAILDDGRVPTRSELRAWVVGDDAVQLAFPMLTAHTGHDTEPLRAVLDAHLGAVRNLRAHIRPRLFIDANERARLLLELRRSHLGARIIAFTAHAATAEALYRALRAERGVALLTARGARTAGGARPRSDVIDALAGGDDRSDAVRARDDISLVITTDLLSEGVNLQGASVIVHLDVPWTPAGLDQRVGRAARMGSQHARVHVHGIAPPAAAERLLTLGKRLARKRAEGLEAARAPQSIEQLRILMKAWRGTGREDVHVNVRHDVQDAEGAKQRASRVLVANALATRPGFIAVVEIGGELMAVCGRARSRGIWRVSDSPGDLYATALTAQLAGLERHAEIAPDLKSASDARLAIEGWLAKRRARESSGGRTPASRARRAVLARLDASVRGATPHARAILASRIAAVRALIDHAVSAGAEYTLEGLARTLNDITLESWLTACEARLARAEPQPPPRTPEPGAVRALLLLRGPA